MIFNINSTRGQNAGPHVRSTGNLSSVINSSRSKSTLLINTLQITGSSICGGTLAKHTFIFMLY